MTTNIELMKILKTSHDTNHLFNCPSDPTTLRPIDLWKKPARTADFLKFDEGIT